MTIKSATFVKGIVGPDEALAGDIPQVAFIGRSNVGKSSVINALTREKGLAKTSSMPGLTKEINLFLINKSFFLVDLPGYGYAKASREVQERLQRLIYWYLFESEYKQRKVILIIDANVGATENDLKMIYSLEEHKKTVVIAANKVDKLKKSVYEVQMQKIRDAVGNHRVIPCSTKKNTGISELLNEVLK
ncbi:MAG: ribosome biogenesis GTP-binding protein YihA/YsxC [bacterium]|nr:ribosome biogenesis GTP-binding protein YihA/YsxC [bacterium]